jgi:two-component system heavy metal sensor histidine kinase CusS
MAWMIGAMLAGLAVFATAVYIVVYFEEEEEVEAGTLDDADASARDQVLESLALAAPIALGLSVIAALWASRRVLAPIDDAIHTAAAISIDRFDSRMEVADASIEVRRLAVAINELLDRLQRGYVALAAFSSDASHELRTPIAAVSSELETALRRPRSAAEWEASARTSLVELHRLGGVVDAMLRFAQADAIRDADASTVDLADVVEDVAAMHIATAGKRDVSLRIDLGAAETKARVRGSADLLTTAVANLVSNALRLTPARGEVVVSLVAAGDHMKIIVDDTGPGLPPDTASLFVPFNRAPDSSGVGLGLAITKRIVDRHGGTVTAADRTSGGARFTIELPIT